MSNKVLQVSGGISVCVSVQNPRIVSISPIGSEYEILDENGKLVGLDYQGDIQFRLNDILKIDKQAYKILFIEKEESPKLGGPAYLLRTQKKLSKTSNFIMPFLGYNKVHFRWPFEFTNAFIGTEENADYGDSLYLLYRFNGSIGFTYFEEKLKQHKDYENSFDIDPYQVLYKFKLPEEFQEDIDKILRGKYSTISLKAKMRILEFHQTIPEGPLGQILNKSEQRRLELEKDLNKGIKGKHTVIPKGQELLDIFNIDEEIFLNKYIIQDAE